MRFACKTEPLRGLKVDVVRVQINGRCKLD
jgi:hypothetical protein